MYKSFKRSVFVLTVPDAFSFAVPLLAFMVVVVSPVSAANLSVRSSSGSSEIVVPVMMDNPADIAGAAFTLVYSEALAVRIESSFFGSFYEQFDKLDTTGDPESTEYGSGWKFPLLDGDGAPVLDGAGQQVYVPAQVDVGGMPYTDPFVDNVAHPTAVYHRIAAVRSTPAEADDDRVLFVLNISLKKGYMPGIYPLSIVPTPVNVEDAGYDPAGETVDLVVARSADRGIFTVIGDPDFTENVSNGRVVFTDSDCYQIIEGFSAENMAITKGDQTRLAWDISGDSEVNVEIDNNVGSDLGLSGSQQVSPEKTTTYTITAESDCWTVSQKLTIQVASNVGVTSSGGGSCFIDSIFP